MSNTRLCKSSICLTHWAAEGYLVLLTNTHSQLQVKCSWQCYDCNNKWQTSMVLLFIRLLASERWQETRVRWRRGGWRRTDEGRCSERIVEMGCAVYDTDRDEWVRKAAGGDMRETLKVWQKGGKKHTHTVRSTYRQEKVFKVADVRIERIDGNWSRQAGKDQECDKRSLTV